MAKIKSIKKEELKDLQDNISKANKIQMQIGGIEAGKLELLEVLKKTTEDLKVIQEALTTAYGDVNIDLQTGEISDEKAVAANKKN
jgi:hypothetical protein|tara:strand:+ start:341 stop:598 length:258 start_codon:yes stop_codon:yes gene_type:complete